MLNWESSRERKREEGHKEHVVDPLLGFMLIIKLYPRCIKAGIYILSLEMVSIIDIIDCMKEQIIFITS